MDFSALLLGTLGAGLLENTWTGKVVKAKIFGRRVIRAGEGTFRPAKQKIRAGGYTIRAGQNF